MADASGTPSTNFSIPKFNTSVDAPSGKGTNTIVDFVDNLLTGFVKNPSGIAANEVPVWNGTTWVRSSVTNIGYTSLGSGGDGTGTHYLADDGTWKTISTPSYTFTTYTPTVTGFVSVTASARYVQIGKMVVFVYSGLTTGTSNSTAMTISTPIAGANLGVPADVIARVQNNGTVQAGLAEMPSTGGSTINVWPTPNGGTWTASGAKGALFTLIYEAA